MDKYIPVSCDFHDELEALATLRQDCQIVYRNEADEVVEVNDRIVDVYAANHADYMKLRNGTEIRLDRVVSVNGKTVSYC
jgi:Rho-binding antiterminator